MQLDFNLYIRRALTTDQQALLRFQRNQLPVLNDDEGSDSNDSDYCYPQKNTKEWSKKQIAKFISMMKDFTPTSEFDKNLVSGVL